MSAVESPQPNKYHRIASPESKVPITITDQSCSFSPDVKSRLDRTICTERASKRIEEIETAEADLERIAEEINQYRIIRAQKLKQPFRALEHEPLTPVQPPNFL